MNRLILDGQVQKDVKLWDEVCNFNISSITGQSITIEGNVKNRFTYIKVVYPEEVTPRIEQILTPGQMIRVYGKIDSEQYITSANKKVYNKIVCAENIVRIRFDVQSQDYIEVP